MSAIRSWRLGALVLLAAPVGALASENNHFIFDADVVLFDDFDSDGHYRFLSVRIDADTFLSDATVFVELYLRREGTDVWELFHASDDFVITGQTSDDEFFIETELLSGYPTGFYDLLIELYDETGIFCDEIGPFQSTDFALLPLEDATQDTRPVELTVIEGGGGAFSFAWLGALLATGLWARRRKSKEV